MRAPSDADKSAMTYWCKEELVPLIDTALIDGVDPNQLAVLLLGLSYEVLVSPDMTTRPRYCMPMLKMQNADLAND